MKNNKERKCKKICRFYLLKLSSMKLLLKLQLRLLNRFKKQINTTNKRRKTTKVKLQPYKKKIKGYRKNLVLVVEVNLVGAAEMVVVEASLVCLVLESQLIIRSNKKKLKSKKNKKKRN